MQLNPYDTDAAKAFVMTKTEREIRKHITLNSFDDYSSQMVTVAMSKNNRLEADLKIYQIIPGDDRITPFFHPILMSIMDRTSGIFIDARPYTRLDPHTRVLSISEHNQYNLTIDRAVLQLAAIDGGGDNLFNLGKYPITVYANWLAEVIARRSGVDADVQVRIAAISALYFISQLKEGDFEPRDLIAYSRLVGECSYMTASAAMEIIEPIGKIESLEKFLAAIKVHAGSIRLESLSIALLYTYLGGSWFGMNRIELMGVAIENPPAFIALSYQALTAKSYRNTELSRMALRYERSQDAQSFLRAYRYLVDGYKIIQ